jgi:hypothetical protein
VCQKSLKDAAILHRGQSCGRTAARSGAPYWLAMAAVGERGAAQRGIAAPSSVRCGCGCGIRRAVVSVGAGKSSGESVAGSCGILIKAQD